MASSHVESSTSYNTFNASSSQGGSSSTASANANGNTAPSDLPSNNPKDAAGATAEQLADRQSTVLPHKQLMIVFPAIALAQFTSYLDQTCVSTAMPAIASGLDIGSSISWVASSFLLASTSIQLINGRLSDIFGRKACLLTALGLLGLGNLGSGFATSPGMMFASRAVSGLGGGAINAIVMIISSDITTLKDRGKYNGFIGSMVALGNGLGPLLGGVLTEKASWRWTLWVFVPLIAFVMFVLVLALPPSKTTGSTLAKLRLIDWLGIVVNVAAVLLILIPISEGGATFPWDSPIVIAMLTTGGVMVGLFVLVEWRFAKLPLMPMRLFTYDYAVNLILVQCVLIGFVYWANLFYISVYLQNVHGYSPILAGSIILPMVFTHGIGSTISGVIISRTGHYNPVLITSHGIWVLGVSLQCLYSRTTPVWAICLIGFLQGIGVGGCFQPTLIALLAHSRKADRAVVNSLRNFLRAVGGAVGLTVSGTVLNNVLANRLSGVLPSDVIQKLTSSVYALPSLHLTPKETALVLDSYTAGLHTIFVMYAPVVALSFILACCVKDHGVAEKDASSEERRALLKDSRTAEDEEGTTSQ